MAREQVALLRRIAGLGDTAVPVEAGAAPASKKGPESGKKA